MAPRTQRKNGGKKSVAGGSATRLNPASPTALPAPRKGSKGAERLAREIVRRIYEMDLKPGDKFLSEVDALTEFKVARGTLREALRYLQIQGVLNIRTGPGGGHFVSSPQWENLAHTLALMLQFAGASMQSLIDARAMIEPAMAKMAAENVTDADLKVMDDALAALRLHIGNYPVFHMHYMRFWDGLAGATQNPLFFFLSPALRRITESSRMVPNEISQAEVVRQAKKIRDAVAAGDPAKAFSTMSKLEERYRTNLPLMHPRKMAKVISWADFQDEI